MFEKILLVYKENISEEGKRWLEQLRELLSDRDLTVVTYDALEEETLHDKDLVITYGGDGTFVKVANMNANTFMVGINSEPSTSEGALTNLHRGEVDKVKDILNGNFNIIERQRAEVILNGEKLEGYSLNEVYAGAALQFHSSRYRIHHRGKNEEHRSSGVLVSTGTGSTAWFKSAGGKPFHHNEMKLAFIIREPYIGKRVFCPNITEGEILPGEKLTIESKRDFGGIIAVDYVTHNFNKGDLVEVVLSKNPLKVLEPKQPTNPKEV